MAETTARRPASSLTAPRLATLLAIAIFINYVDRGNLGTAAPVVKDELHLTATQIGLLLSAFWTCAGPDRRWLAMTARRGKVIALGITVRSWHHRHGLASSFAIMTLRLVLRIEGVAFPSVRSCWQHVR
jgi:hypothetical protein